MSNEIELSKKMELAAEFLPAMDIAKDASLSPDGYYIKFKHANKVTVVQDKEDHSYPLSEVTFRIVSCTETKTMYTGTMYRPSPSGDESYICVILLRTIAGYCFCTLLLRKALTKLAGHVNQRVGEVAERLREAGKAALIPISYLQMPFTLTLDTRQTTGEVWEDGNKVTKNFNYFNISDVKFLPATDIESAIAAFKDLADEFETAKKSAKKFLLPAGKAEEASEGEPPF